MFDSLTASIGVFVFAAAAITASGMKLSQLADQLADRTGWGEALMGGLFLAGVTSLPDFAATLTAAIDSYAVLAMGNVMGSLAVNFAFLAIGDIFYRRANLEHAAATSSNMLQTALFICLLTMPLTAMIAPGLALWGIHPVTPLLIGAYIFGYRAVQRSHERPMWLPRHTAQTVEDKPNQAEDNGNSLITIWIQFGLFAVLVAVAGWALMNAAETIAIETPLSETAVGSLFTAISTSLPELVTTIAAIRYGALTLAVSNIVGTNCFNLLVIAAADIAYRPGSIYHAIDTQQLIWGMMTILMAAILLLGFLYRERIGIARIGFESFLILVIYVGMAASALLL